MTNSRSGSSTTLCTGVEITVDTPVNRQRRFRDRILIVLGIEIETDSSRTRMLNEYADVVAFTTSVKGDAGFELPTPTSTDEEIRNSFKVYDDSVDAIQSEEWLNFVRKHLLPSSRKRAQQPPPLTDQEKKQDPN